MLRLGYGGAFYVTIFHTGQYTLDHRTSGLLIMADAREEEGMMLDALREAFQAWHDAAVEAIESHHEDYIGIQMKERWVLLQNNEYYRRQQAGQYVWLAGASEKLQGLPAYAAARQAAEAHPAIGGKIDQIVGTALGLSSFRFDACAMAVLPSPVDLITDIQSSTFDSRFNKLVQQVTSATAEYRVYHFLQGISLYGERLELDEDLAIQQLSSEDLESALELGLVRVPLASAGIFKPEESASFALVRTWRLPRIVGRDISQEERDAISGLTNPSEMAERFLQCMALLSGAGVCVTGIMTKRIDNDFSQLVGAIVSLAMPTSRFPTGSGLVLGQTGSPGLQGIWQKMHSNAVRQDKSLSLAIRRLGFAAQRVRPEDRLIDIFIAAEAFYLDDSDRDELKYRLALRAAFWSEGTLESWSRREVFAQMKLGYDLRSKVAHGGEPRPRDIKVRGELASLADAVSTAEDILRAALRKALIYVVRAAEAGLPRRILWDDLIIPEEVPAKGEDA